jgi:hypothetical protein
VAQLIAQAAQAVVFAPTVWRVLRGDGTASGRGQVGRQPAPA